MNSYYSTVDNLSIDGSVQDDNKPKWPTPRDKPTVYHI